MKKQRRLKLEDSIKMQELTVKRMSVKSYLDNRKDLSTLFHKAYGKMHTGKLLTEADWDKIIK